MSEPVRDKVTTSSISSVNQDTRKANISFQMNETTLKQNWIAGELEQNVLIQDQFIPAPIKKLQYLVKGQLKYFRN